MRSRVVSTCCVLALVVLCGASVEVRAQGDSPSNATTSGCHVCAATGDCAHAYRGDPGQFCGNWLDRASQKQPCCCPNAAVCKLSNYACNCAYSGAFPPYRDTQSSTDGLLWLWWFLGVLLLALCCGGCCYLASRQPRDGEAGPVPVATPAGEPAPGQPYRGAPVYATAPPVYEGYGGYGGAGRGLGAGAGAGAALGGTAGLLGGMMLGSALADAGDYDGGCDGAGGEFGGDF